MNINVTVFFVFACFSLDLIEAKKVFTSIKILLGSYECDGIGDR